MGHFKNRVLIVAGSDLQCKKARKKAFFIYNKIFKDEFSNKCITEIVGGYCNSHYSFMIGADGGNTMKETEIKSNTARDLFIEWLQENKHDYISLNFGGDDKFSSVR